MDKSSTASALCCVHLSEHEHTDIFAARFVQRGNYIGKRIKFPTKCRAKACGITRWTLQARITRNAQRERVVLNLECAWIPFMLFASQSSNNLVLRNKSQFTHPWRGKGLQTSCVVMTSIQATVRGQSQKQQHIAKIMDYKYYQQNCNYALLGFEQPSRT